VRLIGRTNAAERAPTVAFTVNGQRASTSRSASAAANLGVGAGNFYAYRLVKALGVDPDEGVVRTSFVHYTSRDDITRLISALDTVA
jgi:selenocysteine lyase/cysteine desulfurase